mmetsp:Transcript_50074/g.95649  ORF Transcript_50074/g.95649 Transcript_50074/m.95649 type:complete len:422 (+) Transcript_50074:2174-3439(+)
MPAGHVDLEPGRRGPLVHQLPRGGANQAYQVRCHLHQLVVAGVEAEHRLLVRGKASNFNLVQLVLRVDGQYPGFTDEGHQEVLVVHLLAAAAQRPHAFDAGQLHSCLLVDADAVAYDAQRAVLADARARHNKSLPLMLQVHNAQVNDWPEVGVCVHHLHKAALRVHVRVQLHQLGVARAGPDVHHSIVQVRYGACAGRLPELLQFEVGDVLAVVIQRKQIQQAVLIAQQIPRTVGIHPSIGFGHGQVHRDGFHDLSVNLAVVQIHYVALAHHQNTAQWHGDWDDDCSSRVEVELREGALSKVLLLEIHFIGLDMTHLLRVLVQHRDGGAWASVEEVDIDNLQLFQADVECIFEVSLITYGDHLEVTIIEMQPDHPALRVDDPNLTLVCRAANFLVYRALHLGFQVPSMFIVLEYTELVALC